MFTSSDFLKITQLAYRLLDFLPDHDPLKNKAKEKALAILENITLVSGVGGWVALSQYLSEERQKNALQAIEDIQILQNYFKVAKNQGWMDGANVLIITNEYERIKKQLERVSTPKLSTVTRSTRSDLVEKEVVRGPTSQLPDGKANKRQEKILAIMASKEKTQVADILRELPDITKRTIRRDLTDLLKRGEISRFGAFNQVFYKKSH